MQGHRDRRGPGGRGRGTRVTVSQSGFGPWLPKVLETFRVVWNLIVADLALYIERKIALETHLFNLAPPRVTLGLQTQDRLGGLSVLQVEPGSFGERVGVVSGDLLLSLNGVRLLYGTQLLDLQRVCRPGNELELVWAHEHKEMRATAHV